LNERAFNLFTALLALILIVLTSVLVSSMMQSESNTKTIISKLVNQSKLESMSRLVRADAFQSFNYTTREKIEEWLSRPDNDFTIDEREKWEDWDLIVDEFANDKFRNADAFARFLGDNLPSSITKYGDKYSGSYEIDVDFDRDSFIAAVKEVIERSADDDDFFEIIDCDGTPQGCPNGSFYLNLKFSQISQELYEEMPLLTVRDTRSGRELKDPVIPRNDLKIYMPIRIFRALATMRGFMHSELDSEMNSQYDKGFLSPRFHNELDVMALGFCDYGYCAPRENPYFPPPNKGIDSKYCPGYLGAPSVDVNGEFRGLPFEYKAGSKASMESSLGDAVKTRLCDLSRELLLPYDDPEFGIDSQMFKGEECFISMTDIEKDTTPSKQLQINGGGRPLNRTGIGSVYTVDQEPNHFESPVILCPNNFYLNENRKIGVFYEAGMKAPDSSFGAEVCSGFNVTGASGEFLRSCDTVGRGSWGCCSEISKIKLLVVFKELNPRYKVVKNRDVQFTIGIDDRTFTPFNPNHDFGYVYSADCALDRDVRNGGCDKDGWTCYVPSTGTGCYPPTGV